MSRLDLFALAWTGLAIVAAAALLRINAPYGRHAKPGFGPSIPALAGWIVMEVVSPITMAILFIASGPTRSAFARVFFALWTLHYVQRSFVHPFRARIAGKTMPLFVAVLAGVFNLVNAGMNGTWAFFVSDRSAAWFVDPRFIAGCALFAAGLVLNVRSDSILSALRAPGETGYRIPDGGAFRFVSCPNYLGEIVEWCGFALAVWSLPALSFAAWTAANLVPRAIAHHRWYHERFPAYPPHRKAILPFLL